MQIQLRDGVFDVTNPKPDSTSVIRDFLHLRTKQFTQQACVEIDDYFGALIFTMIIGWKQIRKNPIVQNKLNHFEQKAILDRVFTEMSNDIVAQLPSRIKFHQGLIKSWRTRFTRKELEDAIDENEEVNLDVGQYAIIREDEIDKKRVQFEKAYGSNADAQIKVLVIKGVSLYQGAVFVIVSVSFERYKSVKEKYEARSSIRISKDERESMFKGSRVSDGIRMIDQQDDIDRESKRRSNNNRYKEYQDQQEGSETEQSYQRGEKTNKFSEVRPISDSDPPVGFCKNTNKFRVIDRNTQESLESFENRDNNNSSLIDIITFVLFISIAIFLALLIYYNSFNKQFDQHSPLAIVNNFAIGAHDIFENILSFCRSVYQQ